MRRLALDALDGHAASQKLAHAIGCCTASVLYCCHHCMASEALGELGAALVVALAIQLDFLAACT